MKVLIVVLFVLAIITLAIASYQYGLTTGQLKAYDDIDELMEITEETLKINKELIDEQRKIYEKMAQS